MGSSLIVLMHVLCQLLHCNLHSTTRTDAVEEFLHNGNPVVPQHYLTSTLMNQMIAKARMQKHEDRLKEVLFTKFLQLNNINAFIPMHKKDLSREQIKNTLRVISVIKKKRNDTLKRRTCVVGTPQRKYYENLKYCHQ